MTREQEIALLRAMYGADPPADPHRYNPSTLMEQNRWLNLENAYLQERLRERGRELSWWRCCAVAVAALLIAVAWAAR